MVRTSALLGAVILVGLAKGPASAATDWKIVEQILGRPAPEQPGGVHRFSLPRLDLKVTLDGIAIKPALALGSWIAFEEMNDQTMVMGDLVLTEAEVAPVMSRLAEGGIEITALHNHLLRAQPATMYMHVEGHGDAVQMARSLRLALEESQTPIAFQPPTEESKGPAFDLPTVEHILGHPGKANGGVYQFGIPRAEPVTQDGMKLPPSMGTGIAINFQPIDDGKAATTGDFVLAAQEVNLVLRELRAHGIEVTALHNHMLAEQPSLFFMHFWGVGEPANLAEGLKAALDKVNVAKS